MLIEGEKSQPRPMMQMLGLWGIPLVAWDTRFSHRIGDFSLSRSARYGWDLDKTKRERSQEVRGGKAERWKPFYTDRNIAASTVAVFSF